MTQYKVINSHPIKYVVHVRRVHTAKVVVAHEHVGSIVVQELCVAVGIVLGVATA